jgi:diacylglycerol kinase family enzyme
LIALSTEPTPSIKAYIKRGKEVFIDTDPDQPVWTDGEYTGRTPISLKVVPQALPVVVPREVNEKRTAVKEGRK